VTVPFEPISHREVQRRYPSQLNGPGSASAVTNGPGDQTTTYPELRTNCMRDPVRDHHVAVRSVCITTKLAGVGHSLSTEEHPFIRTTGMKKSLIPTENIETPEELKHFFDDPPLLGNERREDYEALFLMIAKAVRPADLVEWIMVRDAAHYCWEIRRERRIKADIIKLKQKEALGESSFRMTREDYMREQAIAKGAAESPSAFKKKESKPEAKKEDPTSGLSEAYILGARDIDIIDTRIASYEHRRNSALREISLYSEAMARRADKATRDVIDGEFTEAAE
jgi:hypothetical protein